MKRFLSKVLKTVTKQSSFYLCLLIISSIIVSFATRLDGRIANIIGGLIASLIVTISVLIIDAYKKYKKLIKLEGTYDSYLYALEDDKKINLDKSIGVYKISYEEGDTIMVEKVKSLKNNYKNHLWRGKADISDAYMGQLYWKYFSPNDWADFTGFKQIIIPEPNSTNTKIYLFGLDGLIDQREVLIKRTEKIKELT